MTMNKNQDAIYTKRMSIEFIEMPDRTMSYYQLIIDHEDFGFNYADQSVIQLNKTELKGLFKILQEIMKGEKTEIEWIIEKEKHEEAME